MSRSCASCRTDFPIDDRDQAFYAKMQVPEPTLCPECRLQRRLAWRVERNFYMRKCDLTGKQILSVFPQDHPNKVFQQDKWYGDSFNALDAGREFDFSRPFFPQFAELMREVPFFSLNALSLQNCDFVNQCGWSKNCYFTIEADHNEDCIHCYRIYESKTCVDSAEIHKCERCYECIDCESCFQLSYSQLCEQCRDSSFLFDCRSSNDCFGCVGLRQKKYCMFNEQLTQEEYEKRLAQFNFSNREHLAMARSRLDQLMIQHPRKSFIGEQNENVTGNYIYSSKDCADCFEIRECRDCKYCRIIHHASDCMDYLCWGDKSERMYECQECGHSAHNLRFCSACYDGIHSLTYCYQCCITAANCFGCVGIKKGEYCILNKQYSKDEYEETVEKIIAHMKETGEWGEFFPAEISPHAYNETVAQEQFPLSKEEATKKNFRITKQELLFYKKFRIPIPHLHPDERHRRRMAMRNPRKLWKRECGKCGEGIETTYQPSRPEVVYCEQCYLKEVY